MPIDPEAALSAELPRFDGSWTSEEVILYHLGVGAGMQDPTGQKELAYTYEQDLKVLPSFGTIPAFPALEIMHSAPGIEIDRTAELHAEHELVVHRKLPTEASVTSTPRIAAVWDKGKAAVIVVEVDTNLTDGDLLFTNRFSVFAGGKGGFGGDRGPSSPRGCPNGPPQRTVCVPTLSHQNLLYRLSGDKHPLHIDPHFATQVGYQRPILAGLCTFGIACKAVVDELLDGDMYAITGYRARFAGFALPGDTLVIKLWREDGAILLAADTLERQTSVLTHGVINVA